MIKAIFIKILKRDCLKCNPCISIEVRGCPGHWIIKDIDKCQYCIIKRLENLKIGALWYLVKVRLHKRK